MCHMHVREMCDSSGLTVVQHTPPVMYSICTYLCMHVCLNVCICMCVYMHLHTYVHMYVLTYVCMDTVE